VGNNSEDVFGRRGSRRQQGGRGGGGGAAGGTGARFDAGLRFLCQ
jgi:hypothetical protein